jgi:hypothetical protein
MRFYIPCFSGFFAASGAFGGKKWIFLRAFFDKMLLLTN